MFNWLTKSAVAGVRDRSGGVRVVVTKLWRLHHHVGEGETIYVLPGVWVKEPVPHDDIAPLVHRVVLATP